ncbi:hypothetical protein G6F46_006740 [Rhizopus delemar]|uniref:Yeast cell wall synthesis Kre9/Knh1-like N-terminal domain-containing protein n=3 Tax=Rhizopus TaxID=4842 RepID=I1BZH9_RHIO9|nr:hypothetical protein RO3G_06314 [Rhizopus delemar RA 99-880]KAG1056604.1 hypothetical protein G6F43_001523 [Rhizopus delemar]KAG1543445.1 hypothetical protein G6F51_006671 [Rhizopus arrhizus]KAG1458905.1 hypothetical protein G6F55_005074 [Rhizopus delemar]KAG1493049.1 hypothetical protein G6F54_008866 [Rhizopus delemar]|eukprot:EIE81609.1 hypothetical protein RO3G_06314 [Rhizopus delemar RA 99-880]
MKFVTLYISAAYLASLVLAQKPPVSITSPLANTRYKAGTEAIISWVNPAVKTIPQIVLAKGSSTSLQPVMTIATEVNADDLKYVWKIPKDLPSGDDYAFELGRSPDIAFTGAFTIEGGTGTSFPSQNSTSSSDSNSSSSSGSSNNAGSASTPATSSGSTNSQTSQSAGTSHASSASSQNGVSQAIVAVGLAAVVAQQLF